MNEPREVVVTDVQIPLSSMIVLVLKFTIAMIPFAILQALIGVAIWWFVAKGTAA